MRLPGGRIRVGRGLFWAALIAQGLCATGFVAFAVFVIDPADDDPSAGIVVLEAGLATAYLAFAALALAIAARRLCDRDRSGWWALAAFLPFGGVWLVREVGLARDRPTPSPPGTPAARNPPAPHP